MADDLDHHIAEADRHFQEWISQYRMAFETRNLEVQLFWQRSNYFLALNTAIAVGFFALQDSALRPLLCGLGLVSSFCWFWANLGSKYWQSRWEHRLREAEAHLDPPMLLFREGWGKIDADVRKSLKSTRPGHVSEYSRIINRMIMMKPSVTRTVIALSQIVMLFWMVALVLHFVWAGQAPD
jgi:hypothetical protein